MADKNERLRKFYDRLQEGGVVQGLPDYDRFQAAMQDSAKRQDFYDRISEGGKVKGLPEYNRFKEVMIAEQPQAESVVPMNPIDAAEIALNESNANVRDTSERVNALTPGGGYRPPGVNSHVPVAESTRVPEFNGRGPMANGRGVPEDFEVPQQAGYSALRNLEPEGINSFSTGLGRERSPIGVGQGPVNRIKELQEREKRLAEEVKEAGRASKSMLTASTPGLSAPQTEDGGQAVSRETNKELTEVRSQLDDELGITAGDKIQYFANQFAKTFSTQIPKGFLDAGAQLEVMMKEAYDAEQKGKNEVAEQWQSKMADKVTEWAEAMFPTNKNLQGRFVNDVLPAALGSFGSFILPGGVAGKLTSKATRALGGSVRAGKVARQIGQTGFSVSAATSGGMSEGYRRAKNSEASEEDAQRAGLMGSIPGAIQVFPVVRALNRFNRASSGKFQQSMWDHLREGGKGSVEEFTMEMAGQLGQNAISSIYEEDPDYWEGVAQAGGAGGAAGFIASFFLSALGGKLGKRSGQQSVESEPDAGSDLELKGAGETNQVADTEVVPDADGTAGDTEPVSQSEAIPVEAAPDVAEIKKQVPDSPLRDVLGKRVVYEGKRGILKQDDEGTLVVETPDIEMEVAGAMKDLDKMTGELGISMDTQRVAQRVGDDVTIRSEEPGGESSIREYTFIRENHNEAGELLSVTMRNDKGRLVTVRDEVVLGQLEAGVEASDQRPAITQESEQEASESEMQISEKEDSGTIEGPASPDPRVASTQEDAGNAELKNRPVEEVADELLTEIEADGKGSFADGIRRQIEAGTLPIDESLVNYLQSQKSEIPASQQVSSTDTSEQRSSTQFNLTPQAAKDFQGFAQDIPDSDLFDGDGFGRETEPHVTLLFGLTENDPKAVQQVLAGEGEAKATLGKVSLFKNPDYDVIKVDVESEKLQQLNKKLRDNLPYKSDFPDYQPHITLAYVKKGEGQKYEGDTRFEGQEVDLTNLVFSGPDRTHTNIDLTGKVPELSGDVDPPETVERGIGGQGIDIDFTADGSERIQGRYAVIEADELQASHNPDGTINTNHTISQSQPRDRAGRQYLEQHHQIANKLSPDRITGNEMAFSGAPVTNTRGEAIQGNGRSIALKMAYAHHPNSAEAYRNYLMEHAERFGLDPEQIQQMKMPILTRQLNVSDQEAVRLGNIKNVSEARMSAVEEAKSSVRNLSDERRRGIGRQINESQGETIREILDDRGRAIMDMVDDIDKSQFIADDGSLTPLGKDFLEETFRSLIFDSSENRAAMKSFSNLPHIARRGIERSYGSIIPFVDTGADLSPLLQRAVFIADQVNSSKAISTVDQFMQMGDVFEGFNKDMYTAREAGVARLLLGAKTQKEIQQKFKEYEERIYGKQELFETIEPRGLTEAGAERAAEETFTTRAVSPSGPSRSQIQGAEPGRPNHGRGTGQVAPDQGPLFQAGPDGTIGEAEIAGTITTTEAFEQTRHFMDQGSSVLEGDRTDQENAVHERYKLNPKETQRFLLDMEQWSSDTEALEVLVTRRNQAVDQAHQSEGENRKSWQAEAAKVAGEHKNLAGAMTKKYEGAKEVIRQSEHSTKIDSQGQSLFEGSNEMTVRETEDGRIHFADANGQYGGVLQELGGQWSESEQTWAFPGDMRSEIEAGIVAYKQMRDDGFHSTIADPAVETYERVAEFTRQDAETRNGRKLVKKIKADKDGKKAGVRSIVQFVNDLMDVEMRVGKTQTTRRHPAHYALLPHMIRSRVEAWQFNFHEAGHALSHILRHDQPGSHLSTVWWQEIEADLVGLAMSPGSKASAMTAEEGFAEWARLYIVNRPALPERLNSFIERQLAEKQPEIWKGLKDANRAWYWHRQRSTSSMFRSYTYDQGRDPEAKGFGDLWDNFLFRNVSLEHGITRIQRKGFKAMREAGLKAARNFEKSIADTPADMTLGLQSYINTPTEVSRALEGVRTGREGLRVKRMTDHSVFSAMDQDVLDTLQETGYTIPQKSGKAGSYMYLSDKSFSQIKQAVGPERWAAFETYGHQKESLQRYENKGHRYPGLVDGLTPDRLRAEVNRLERENPNFEQHFKDVNHYFDQLALISLVSGEKTVDDLLNLKKGIDHYWPMPRHTTRGLGGRSEKARPDSGLRRAHGSDMPIRSIDEAAQMRTRRTLDAYYWNNTILSVKRYGQQLAGQPDVPFEAKVLANRIMTPLRLEVEKVATLKPAEGQSIIAEHMNEMLLQAKRDETGDPDTELTRDEIITADMIEVSWNGKDIWRSTEPTAAKIIAPFENGQRRFYQVEDPILFDFMTHSREPAKAIKAFHSVMMPITEAWKKSLTHNVIFSAWQFTSRDIPEAMLMGDGWQSFVPGFYHASGLINRITGKHRVPSEYGEMLSKSFNQVATDAHKSRTENFMDVLGEGVIIPDYKDLTLPQKAAIAPAQLFAAAMKLVEIPLYVTGQRGASVWMESIPREGRAIQLASKGASDSKMEREYGRILGNFGMYPGSANTAAIYRVGGFVNPAAQVNYAHYQKLTHHDPAERAKAWAVKIPYITMMAAAGAAINFLYTDEEDKKKMRERRDIDRTRYKSLFGKLRVPFGYGIPGAAQSFGWNLVEQQLLDDPINGETQAKAILQRIRDFPGHPMSFLSPQITTALELQTNYSFWFEDNIVPSWLETQYPVNPELQYYESTPEIYRRAGEHMNVSPLKVQHAIRQGMGHQMDELLQLITSTMDENKRVREPADIPFIGRTLQREPVGSRSQSVQSLRELDEQYNALKAEFNNLVETRDVDPDELEEIENNLSELQAAKDHMNEIRRMSRHIREEKKREHPDEKHIRRIERQIMEIAQQYFSDRELME